MAKRTHYNINTPTSWEEITLKDFIQIKKLYDKHENNVPIVTLLAHLSGKEESYFKDAPALVITKMVDRLKFLREPLPSDASNTITINDEEYVINTEEEMKFGEFVDSQTILDTDPDNFSALLAVVCRKRDETYDDDYIAKTLNHRIKMFEKQPMTKIQPLINFFMESLITSRITSPQYFKEMTDQANHILQHCESLVENGDGKKYTIWLQKKRLKILKKHLDSIVQQYSPI